MKGRPHVRVPRGHNGRLHCGLKRGRVAPISLNSIRGGLPSNAMQGQASTVENRLRQHRIFPVQMA